MARKRPSKRSRSASRRERKYNIDRQMEDFGDDMERLGKRISARIEERRGFSRGFSYGFFGVLGPLLAGIFGIAIFAIFIWLINFANTFLGISLIAGITTFLSANIGLIFLIMLFFNYASYFSRAFPDFSMVISPFAFAFGITVAAWLVSNAFAIANSSIGSNAIHMMTVFLGNNLFNIFFLALSVGYFVVLLRVVIGKPIIRQGGNYVMPRRQEYRREYKGKRLYRSCENRILGGVCGGIAEYLDVDPTIIRLIWALAVLLWGAGILLYLIAWIIIPRNPNQKCY